MYRDYRNRSNAGTYGTVSHSNHSSLRPPWALTEEDNSRPERGNRRGNNNYNNNNNNRSNVRNTNRRAVNPRTSRNDNAGNRNSDSTTRDRRGRAEGNSGDGLTTRRYGRRTLWPFDRDLPFWLSFYPSTPRTATPDVHGIHERERRTEWELEGRRMEIEERLNTEVVPDIPIEKGVLTVISCDLHMYENTKQHQTEQYECTERDRNPQLVLRRGQHFKLTFNFQRAWNSEYDDLFLDLTVGENPSTEEGTRVTIQLQEDISTNVGRFHTEDGWAAKIIGQGSDGLSVVVFIPADAIIGEWKCVVSTSLVDSEETYEYEGVGEIYILFNPWCLDDQVFYGEDPSDLKEYVLNEYGCVFEGASDYISRKPWFYGQFQEGILDISMTILRMSFGLKITRDNSDVISVVRNLSHILNSSRDAPGIMVGNWSNNYSDGTRPSSWRGSVNILKQFTRTKRPVRYAQCFVFCHVLTTICRALGIPCRSITNFESAHDTDKTATIDIFEDENGERLRDRNSDSIWNYHCWNDVWINRPDLDLTASARGRYSGWHAVDSTPQETSEGRYQCGPSPLTAIKNGEISVGYDTQFIYGEVNGEVCHWMVPHYSDKAPKLLERKPNAVGMNISTKIPDGKPARKVFNPGHREVHAKRMDITDQYKYPEGSREERESLKMAVGDGFGARLFQEAGDLTLDLAKMPSIQIGSNFEVKTYITNKSPDVKEFDITLSVFPIDYRGERIGWDKIATEKIQNITLWPNTREVFVLPVLEKHYLHYCDSSMSMMLHAFVRVKGVEKPLSKLEKFVLSCPDLTVTVPTALKVRREQPFTVTVLVSNPTGKPMTSCSLHLSGTILPLPTQGFTESDGTYIKKIKEVFPNEVRTITFDVMAQRLPLSNHTRELDVDVECTELPNMSGSLDMSVL